MVKIYGHGSYIGNTGYNQHTRDFFRHLSKHAQIKFRNFTVGNTWDGMSSEPHNNEPYLNDVDKKLLFQQVLWNTDKTRSDYKMYEDQSKEFFYDLNIVLCEIGINISLYIYSIILISFSFFKFLSSASIYNPKIFLPILSPRSIAKLSETPPST